ncbi:MAG: radical SAM protein [Bacteroidales bacterium]|nr:radical SAM protein [Bacteroidales bacterium]
MQQVILSYLPPADLYTPSASLSILKSFMLNNGFDTKVKYWNFLFNPILPLADENEETSEVILPFISIINDWFDNKIGNQRSIELLKEKLEDSNKLDSNSIANQLEKSKYQLLEIIDKEVSNINFDDTLLFGFTSKFHQWIPAMVVSKAIKQKSPSAKIVIGGFGSKEAALEAMKMNPHFDFATWGEGEYPLLELSKQLNDKTFDFDNVARLFYRKQGVITLSTTNRSDYLDFHNYPFPSFDDYFLNYPEPDKKYKIVIPINSSRACSWNKCKFCDYNSGYKFRVRSPENIIAEIEFIANKYKSACFSFVDNDIFINKSHFEKLLDLMIASKNKHHYDYEFWAEMIPNENLNSDLMEKMQMAGFSQVFIGYDGISDSLLSKMHKSNNFSNNLFFVKYSLKFDIDPLVNIIIGLINENESDIQESIDNLHFLRFFYSKKETSLYHDYVTLVISRMSKYYGMISDTEKAAYNVNEITYLLPEHFSNHKDRFNLFSWKKPNITFADQWASMKEKEKHYIDNIYSYKISTVNRIPNFKEYRNNELIMDYDFTNPIYWSVLVLANNKVIKFEEILNELKTPHVNISSEKLLPILAELKSMKLIYCNDDFENIITVIDVN